MFDFVSVGRRMYIVLTLYLQLYVTTLTPRRTLFSFRLLISPVFLICFVKIVFCLQLLKILFVFVLKYRYLSLSNEDNYF